MAVNVSVPLDFAFKADDVLLVTTQIMAVATALCGVEDRGPAMKGALSLSHRLALLKSTLQDTSPDLGTLDFVPLSGGEAVCFVVCVFFLFPGFIHFLKKIAPIVVSSVARCVIFTPIVPFFICSPYSRLLGQLVRRVMELMNYCSCAF